jgi:hypothetical protein
MELSVYLTSCTVRVIVRQPDDLESKEIEDDHNDDHHCVDDN